MDPLVDGLWALRHQASAVLILLLFAIWGMVVMLGQLPRLAISSHPGSAVSLAVAAWPLPMLALSACALALAIVTGSRLILDLLVALIATIAVVLAWFRGRRARAAGGPLWPALLLAAVCGALILLRLGFIRRLPLPLYFDSAFHYRLIQALAESPPHLVWAEMLRLLPGGYYHLGYHVLLAGIVRLTGMDIADLMLVFGQLVLALVPVAVYALARETTGSRPAAFLAVACTAFGWYMPAHALNWGKVPALFSFLPLLAAITAFYLWSVVGNGTAEETRERRTLLAIAIVAAFCAAAIHTRSILVLALTLVSWKIAGLPSQFNRRHSLPLLLGLGAILVMTVAASQRGQQLFAPLLEPYLGPGLWVTIGVGLLAWPALAAHPRLATACIIALVLLIAGTLVPAPLPGGGALLDRPLVEMLICFPLGMLAAAGLSGSFRLLKPASPTLEWSAAALLALALLVHALGSYSWKPSECCNLVTQDDLVALDWIKHKAPSGSVVAIATAPLQVVSDSYPPLQAGADAGIWVTPLSRHATIPLSHDARFDDERTLSHLCAAGVDYLYAGGEPGSFDRLLLGDLPAWYTLQLGLPTASIYRVTGCPG